jgi:hypothetical protein
MKLFLPGRNFLMNRNGSSESGMANKIIKTQNHLLVFDSEEFGVRRPDELLQYS